MSRERRRPPGKPRRERDTTRAGPVAKTERERARRPDDASPHGPSTGRLGRIHDRVIDALAGVEEGLAADRTLARTFQRARDLGSSERREVTETVYGVIRARRRLEDRLRRAARAAGRNLDILESTIFLRMLVLVYHAEHGADASQLAARDAYAFRRVPGVMERIVEGRIPEGKPKSPAAAIGLRWSLPDWMVERLIDGFGEERAEAIARALSVRAPLALRVNRLRATREEAAARIREEHGVECEPGALSPDALIVPPPADVEGWPIYREGVVEVQDEGSQLLAMALGAAPGQAVLDACAGAGGKTLALAAAMGGGGHLTAVDTDAGKLDELRRRVRRAGLNNVEALQADLLELPERLRGWADRVLVDAPCTGTGRLRRQPDARWRIDEKDLVRLVPIQIGLLGRAVQAAKPGGLIVYATCSVLREENEAVVEHVLRGQPAAEPAPLSSTWGEALAGRLGVGASHLANIGPGPGERDPDGFFVALLRRKES